MGIPTKVTPGAPSLEKPSPLLVFDTLMAHQRTAALRAAIELDVFRAVGEGPGDVASLARQCSASERGIRILPHRHRSAFQRRRMLPPHSDQRAIS
jgi:hypothetical protein